ncbi:MAG: hypothetical protein MUF05_01325 [Candidatus Omnitrophica bacterium]|jgi:hypothetical protein|nr:hypothetical protein [Candidatus Omnitrophota bacterium]
MPKRNLYFLDWDYFSCVMIALFFTMQVVRWQILPQFMDIYYHLHTAWGFLQAGGYSGWDFWQYAPYGREHIYPPFFHIILAIFMKLGVKAMILAKVLEITVTIFFFLSLWLFTKRNFSSRVGFFSLLVSVSSYSFLPSLTNHLPATVALILGLWAMDALLSKRFILAIVFLTLCFYTHIGASFFMAAAILIFSFLNKGYRKMSWFILFSAFILSLPILIKEILVSRHISSMGFNLNERYNCEIKIIEYIMACFGVYLSFKMKNKNNLTGFCLFAASLIFVSYPYRLFSAEGYLGVVLPASLALDFIYQKIRQDFKMPRMISLGVILIFVLISPSFLIRRTVDTRGETFYRVKPFNSALSAMLIPALNKPAGLWFPEHYSFAADWIRANSSETDIIYCSINCAGVALAALSGRPTSNALLPEIGPVNPQDPFLFSRVIVLAKDEQDEYVQYVKEKYSLVKSGEDKLFPFYMNNKPLGKYSKRPAAVSFTVIYLLLFLAIFLSIASRRLERFLRQKSGILI